VLLGLVLTMFGHIRPIGDLVGKPSIEVGWTVLLVILRDRGRALRRVRRPVGQRADRAGHRHRDLLRRRVVGWCCS